MGKLSIHKLRESTVITLPYTFFPNKNLKNTKISLLPDSLQNMSNLENTNIKMTKESIKVAYPLKLNSTLKCHRILSEHLSPYLKGYSIRQLPRKDFFTMIKK